MRVCVFVSVWLSVYVPIRQVFIKKYTYSAIPDPRCPALAYSSYNSMFGPRTVVLVSKPCTHVGAHGICERHAGKRICHFHDNSWLVVEMNHSGSEIKIVYLADAFFSFKLLTA